MLGASPERSEPTGLEPHFLAAVRTGQLVVLRPGLDDRAPGARPRETRRRRAHGGDVDLAVRGLGQMGGRSAFPIFSCPGRRRIGNLAVGGELLEVVDLFLGHRIATPGEP